MVAIIRSSFALVDPAGRGARTAFLRHAVQRRPRDPRPLPGEHGGAAQQAAAGARARRADGRPARRARALPASSSAATTASSACSPSTTTPSAPRCSAPIEHVRRPTRGRPRSRRPGPRPTPSSRSAMRTAADAERGPGLLAGPGGRAPADRLGPRPDHRADQRAHPVPGRPVRERRDAAAAAAVALPLARPTRRAPTAPLEFHVRAVSSGWVSRAIVAHSRVGDTWRIGPPMGRMHVDPQLRHATC